jgi:predicted Zn-dependent peptidase
MPTPPAVTGDEVVAFHRAGSVQSQARLSTAGVLITDPEYPAAQLANIVFGGYFSSRLMENLREDKGFTYHVFSMLEFWPERSAVTIGYDTATEVTAAALNETRYELGRIAVTPVTEAEVDAARNYAIGSLAASLASQAGYASMLSSLRGSGLDGDWLRQHPRNLAATSAEQVAAAAERLFAPVGLTGIVLGDLETTGDGLRLIGVVRQA